MIYVRVKVLWHKTFMNNLLVILMLGAHIKYCNIRKLLLNYIQILFTLKAHESDEIGATRYAIYHGDFDWRCWNDTAQKFN